MTSLYTENSEKWKSLASIDYFTQFVKAWIPFNAWYKNYYTGIKTDREAINEIKKNSKFRNKLISLLKDNSNDGIVFRSYIARLHWELERKHLFNKSDRITFERISIESNSKKTHVWTYSSITYKVEREISEKPKKEIQICVIGKKGQNCFNYAQIDGFSLDDLTSHQDFLKLSRTQRETLKICYEEINPSKPINLLIQDPELIKRAGDPKAKREWIKIENFLFINDEDKICKGIIEVLYKLRNVLFHGEIIPDNDTNKVYEPAYQILYALIQAL